jgi:hypothetical protein
MKKRLRKTGEIVDVVSFNNFYQSERDDSDQVSYIDSKGVEHHHVRGLNLWWDFEDIPIEDTRIPDFDWEQRRYEIAKEVFASIYGFTIDRINFAKYAVDAADALIAELKKGGLNNDRTRID